MSESEVTTQEQLEPMTREQVCAEMSKLLRLAVEGLSEDAGDDATPEQREGAKILSKLLESTASLVDLLAGPANVCAACGYESAIEDIPAHLKVCERHPLRAEIRELEGVVAALKAENAEMRDEIARLLVR